MNNKTGDCGLGVKIQYFDKVFDRPLCKIKGYSIALRDDNSFDAWLICGGSEAFVHLNRPSVDDKIEIIGEL